MILPNVAAIQGLSQKRSVRAVVFDYGNVLCLEQGDVAVQCINRLILDQVEYDLVFGPVGYQ